MLAHVGTLSNQIMHSSDMSSLACCSNIDADANTGLNIDIYEKRALSLSMKMRTLLPLKRSRQVKREINTG